MYVHTYPLTIYVYMRESGNYGMSALMILHSEILYCISY